MSYIEQIDPIIFELDDPRIDLLKKGDAEDLIFLKLIRENDPFEMINGTTLHYITQEEIDTDIKNFLAKKKSLFEQTGLVDPQTFLKYKDVIISVFPELNEDFQNAKNIIEKPSCPSCELNRALIPAIVKMFALPMENRDLDKLKILGEVAIKKFMGETDLIDEKKIVIAPGLIKNKIPFKKQKTEKTIQKEVTTTTVSTIVKEKTTDRKQIIEILLTAANIELAAEHAAEIVAINSDKMTQAEAIIIGDSCKRLRETRRDLLLKAQELVPQIKGWWCVAKHLPSAEIQFYELYTQTGDMFYATTAKKIKLVLDDLLNIDSSINFTNCPRCEEDKNI